MAQDWAHGRLRSPARRRSRRASPLVPITNTAVSGGILPISAPRWWVVRPCRIVRGAILRSIDQRPLGLELGGTLQDLSLIHISEPTRRTPISYAVFCLKKKK